MRYRRRIETVGSRIHNAHIDALWDLEMETPRDDEHLRAWTILRDWREEAKQQSPGGCVHLRFDGRCVSPNHGTCDGALCADIIVEGTRAYVYACPDPDFHDDVD